MKIGNLLQTFQIVSIAKVFYDLLQEMFFFLKIKLCTVLFWWWIKNTTVVVISLDKSVQTFPTSSYSNLELQEWRQFWICRTYGSNQYTRYVKRWKMFKFLNHIDYGGKYFWVFIEKFDFSWLQVFKWIFLSSLTLTIFCRLGTGFILDRVLLILLVTFAVSSQK